MKKIIAILLCSSMLLAGCQQKQDETIPASTVTETVAQPAPETTVPTEAPEIAVPQYNAQIGAISMPLVSKSTAAEDGTEVFIYSYQTVHMTHQDPAVAKSVVLDLMNRIDQTSYDAESIKNMALQNYTPDSGWTPYEYKVAFHTQRLDSGILSLSGETVNFAGGIHPAYTDLSATYDLVTGASLTFQDIVTEDTSDAAVIQLITDTLHQREGLYDGFESIVADKFYHGFEAVTNWYLSDTGLCFYYSVYELAPYAAGTVIAEIPYSSLNGILKDAYFPADRPQGVGSCQYVSFADADLSSYTRFTELIAAKDAPQKLLTTDGLVFDLRIESGVAYEGENGLEFSPEATIFSLSHMTASDAVMIQSDEIMRLTYRVGDQLITEYLEP